MVQRNDSGPFPSTGVCEGGWMWWPMGCVSHFQPVRSGTFTSLAKTKLKLSHEGEVMRFALIRPCLTIISHNRLGELDRNPEPDPRARKSSLTGRSLVWGGDAGADGCPGWGEEGEMGPKPNRILICIRLNEPTQRRRLGVSLRHDSLFQDGRLLTLLLLNLIGTNQPYTSIIPAC